MEDTRSRWDRAYLEALDYDTWGQVEEAIEGYQRLQSAAAAEYVENVLQLTVERRDGIGKLATFLKMRTQELQGSSRNQKIGLDGMKSLKPFMKSLLISESAFPFANIEPDMSGGGMANFVEDEQYQEEEGLQEEEEDEGEDEDEPAMVANEAPVPAGQQAVQGTLRGPPQNLKRGDSSISIFVEKWGFKDATTFMDPTVVVSVRDDQGEVMEAVQETPVSKSNTQTYAFFENMVHVQTSHNKLKTSGAAIFLEFRHFKPAKKKKSVKAYCFLEMDEVQPGPLTLEVYKKPADYKRRGKPSLLTVKPLYLHVEIVVEKRG